MLAIVEVAVGRPVVKRIAHDHPLVCFSLLNAFLQLSTYIRACWRVYGTHEVQAVDAGVVSLRRCISLRSEVGRETRMHREGESTIEAGPACATLPTLSKHTTASLPCLARTPSFFFSVPLPACEHTKGTERGNTSLSLSLSLSICLSLSFCERMREKKRAYFFVQKRK